MVDDRAVRAASREDSASVIGPVGCVHRDGNGALGIESLKQFVVAVGWNVHVARQLDNRRRLHSIVNAGRVFSSIRVAAFFGEASDLLDPLIADLDCGSTAPAGASAVLGVLGAAHDLLLGEVEEHSGLDGPVGLD